MKYSVRTLCGAVVVLLAAVMSGCVPSSQSTLEEQKEPHFMAGKSCVNSMDFQGAVEEFEKALEVNPHSSSAHFELAWLYDEKESDSAAAIYHYQQYLKLRPNSDNADVIKQRIYRCEQDLAKAVLPLPTTPGVQHDLEQLADENRRLRDEVEKWRAYYKAQATNPAPVAAADRTVSAPVTNQPSAVPVTTPTTQPAVRPASRPAGVRTHVVQAGETPYRIAQKYGVKLDALMSANPSLDPKKLRVGQTLNIPAS